MRRNKRVVEGWERRRNKRVVWTDSCAFWSTPMRSMMAAALIGQWSSDQSMY